MGGLRVYVILMITEVFGIRLGLIIDVIIRKKFT
jgi:hypothetical protein